MSEMARLEGASMRVSARIEPPSTPIPSLASTAQARHVVAFVPELDDDYAVNARTSARDQRVVFVNDDGASPHWKGVTTVPSQLVLDPEDHTGGAETEKLVVPIAAADHAAPGSSDVLQTALRATRRWDHFTGEWADLPANAPAFRCEVSVRCQVQG